MIVPARSPRPTRKGPGRAPVRGGKAKEGDFTDRRHVSAELRICGWRLNFGAYSLELCDLSWAILVRKSVGAVNGVEGLA